MPGKIVLKTVNEILRGAERRLRPKKIHCVADLDEGRLDAEVLLGYLLKKDRSWVVAHGNDRLSGILRLRFERLVKRRAAREPIAHIIGKKEFYGRPFHVSRATLIPRPETELFIDILRSRFRNDDAFLCCDVGTGSGAIALTVALEFPKSRVIATDVSRAALAVAAKNARAYGLAERVTFVKGDLLSSNVIACIGDTIADFGLRISDSKKTTRNAKSAIRNPDVPFVLAANLPYLPERDAKKMDADVVEYEPHAALFAGADGLDLIRRLLAQVENDLPTNPDLLLLEFDPPQAKALKKLARDTFPLMEIVIHNDLAGRNRVIELKS